jgi:hypothetical protein
MRGCLQAIAGFVAAIFVLTAVTALIGYNLIVVATDREAVKELFAGLDEVVRQSAPALIMEAARQEALARGITDLPLDEAQIETAVATVIPPGWMDAQAAAAVDGLYDYLETGDPAAAEVTLDTRPLLDSLLGPAGQQMVTAVITNLPPCTDVPNFSTVGNVEVPDCLAPGTNVQEVSAAVHTAVVQAIESNPELLANTGAVRLPLFGEEGATGISAERRAELERVQRNFMLARSWGWALWLLPLACLLLIALLVVRSLPTWGHWWGWPLVMAAVVTLFFAILMPALLTFTMRTAVPAETVGPLTLPIRQLGLNLVTTVADRWLGRVYFQAGILLALGVGLVLMAFGVTAVRDKGY